MNIQEFADFLRGLKAPWRAAMENRASGETLTLRDCEGTIIASRWQPTPDDWKRFRLMAAAAESVPAATRLLDRITQKFAQRVPANLPGGFVSNAWRAETAREAVATFAQAAGMNDPDPLDAAGDLVANLCHLARAEYEKAGEVFDAAAWLAGKAALYLEERAEDAAE